MKLFDIICCIGILIGLSVAYFAVSASTSPKIKNNMYGNMEVVYEFKIKDHLYLKLSDGGNGYVVHAGHCQVRHY